MYHKDIDIRVCTTIIPSTTTNIIVFFNIHSACFSYADRPQALKHMVLNPVFSGVLNLYIIMPEDDLQDRDV